MFQLKAENINNLPPGYYEQQLGVKELDWLRCYVGGQYVYVKEGKSVWQEFDASSMVDDQIEPNEELPRQVGID